MTIFKITSVLLLVFYATRGFAASVHHHPYNYDSASVPDYRWDDNREGVYYSDIDIATTPEATSSPYPQSTTSSSTSTSTSTSGNNELSALVDEVLGIIINGKDDNETTTTNASETKQDQQPETGKSPNHYSSLESDDTASLVEKVFEMMINDEDENETTSNHTKLQAKVAEINLSLDSLVKKDSAEKTPINCSANGGSSNNQYNANCDLVESYYVIQHHWKNTNAWVVLFNIKDTTRQATFGDEVPRQYVVRSQLMSQQNPGEIVETRFVLVPWKDNQHTVAIDALQVGEYRFQICAMTDSFKPTLLDNDQFSWSKHASTHRVHLHPTSAEEKLHNVRKRAPIYVNADKVRYRHLIHDGDVDYLGDDSDDGDDDK